jgi:hypothetical protein
MRATVLPTVPRHLGEHQRHSAGTGDTGEEESTTEEEWQDREPWIHGKCQNRADGLKRADNNLNLPHDREHVAGAASADSEALRTGAQGTAEPIVSVA